MSKESIANEQNFTPNAGNSIFFGVEGVKKRAATVLGLKYISSLF